MMNPVIPNDHCRVQTNDAATESFKSLSRRLTEADLIIDFNALDTVSTTLDDSVHLSSRSYKSEGKVNKEAKTKVLQATKVHPDITTVTVTKETELDVDDATALTVESSVASSVSFLTTPAATKSMKSVRFGSLTIRSHAVELGGSGVPGCGPAVTLGWAEDSEVTIPSVEAYEEARPCLPRRGIEMLLPRRERVDMMLASGYTLNQIRLCSKECEELRKLRTRTVQQLSFADRTKSKLKKLVVWKKSRKVNSV